MTNVKQLNAVEGIRNEGFIH